METYKGHTIERTDPMPPIPYRGCDWCWADEETKDDGPDCVAYGFGSSVEDCKVSIDEHLEDTDMCMVCGVEPAFSDTGVCRWESCENSA